MATAAARLLFLSGFAVVVLERESPLAVRRRVSFAEAVNTGSACVEGIAAHFVDLADVAEKLRRPDAVLVAVDTHAECLAALAPPVVIDARMAKRAGDTHRGQAAFVVGLGPGFTAGADVHAVIETNRGPDLGRVIWQGGSEPDTGEPGPVLGITDKRVVRAAGAGTFRSVRSIGAIVEAGELLGTIDGVPVPSPIGGLVRGLIGDGLHVSTGLKLGDIDPRGAQVDPARISDKARAIAAGVLEAVLLHLRCDVSV
jgi:xanthine dehydrogenase accessory factor